MNSKIIFLISILAYQHRILVYQHRILAYQYRILAYQQLDKVTNDRTMVLGLVRNYMKLWFSILLRTPMIIFDILSSVVI